MGYYPDASRASARETSLQTLTQLDSVFTLSLELDDGYRQRVDFALDDVPPFYLDEPAPLGAGTGPAPTRVLGAALGGCLSASLLFCLRKAKIDVQGLTTTVRGETGRNAKGRVRVESFDVLLEPEVPADQHDRMGTCLSVFEDYCVLSNTLRPSVEITVRVETRVPAAS